MATINIRTLGLNAKVTYKRDSTMCFWLVQYPNSKRKSVGFNTTEALFEFIKKQIAPCKALAPICDEVQSLDFDLTEEQALAEIASETERWRELTAPPARSNSGSNSLTSIAKTDMNNDPPTAEELELLMVLRELRANWKQLRHSCLRLAARNRSLWRAITGKVR